ncbi:MAG: gliding motility-associated C-terminal domain-containing protein, partial [Saprospiraceae bacterium]
PFAETVNYTILDNGLPYQTSLEPCDNDTLTGYALSQIPATGPYTLNQWLVNGQIVGGSFSDLNGLLALMNILDPNGNWHIYSNTYIVGGSLGNSYGTMKITSATGIVKTLNPSIQYVPLGTVMHFVIGSHTVVFRSVISGCADTMTVQVTCTACPPLHDYTSDAFGNIRWTVSNCDFDTIFCTNLPGAQINNFEVKDNGQLFSNFTFCDNDIGFSLDTGHHQLTVRNLSGNCEYLVNFYLACPPPKADTLLAVPDNAVTSKIAAIQIYILDNDIYQGPVQVELLGTTGYGIFTYEPVLSILSYEPDTAHCGPATLGYRITDTLGRQSTTVVTVDVTCDKVIVFNGLSPNGDNLNDVWHIPGIEQFPENEVQVFNRWGSRVLQQKSYTNQTAWGGEWNGKALPDGTYFYVINLGDGSNVLSGYLEILR